MRSVVVLVVLLLLSAQTSFAARAKIEPISRDPYLSALVIDAASGEVLFAENPDAMVYPASVVKLMDLLVILERIERGENRLDEMVQVTNEAAKTGGSQVYLDPKEQFSIEDLLYALMVQSANDAAVALAMHVAGSKDGFVALMNQKAAELGMKNTTFHSVHGLPPSEGQQADRSTAADLALLARALLNRADTLQYTSTTERGFRDNTFIMRTHNHLLKQVEGCDGLKTGYFEAGGFSIAATAKRGGNRVIAMVMGSKDRKVRDAKAAELINKGFAKLPPKAAEAPSAPPAPSAAAAVPAQPAAAVQQAPTGAQPAAGAGQQTAEESQPAPVEETGGGFAWGTFFLGMVAGILLTVGATYFMTPRRPRRGLQ